MKYYLKKTLTLYRQDNKICVGQVNDLDNYLELDYNSFNLQKIENNAASFVWFWRYY